MNMGLVILRAGGRELTGAKVHLMNAFPSHMLHKVVVHCLCRFFLEAHNNLKLMASGDYKEELGMTSEF